MKNFSKKLSFVMATAMVVTSLYAPQNAAAAGKNAMVIKGSKTSVKTKNLFLTGQTVNLDAMVNGHLVKNKDLTWKSSDKSVVSVSKIGVIKAVKASDKPVYVSFTKKGKKKVTVKIAVTVCVRASKMMLTPSAVTVKAGEKAEVAATFELSEKVKAAKAEDTTYSVFAKSSDESAAKVSVDGRKIVVEGVAKSATPVTITVYSTQVKSLAAAEKAKIKLEEKFEVKVMGQLSAQQAGANKIKVMGTDLVASKSAYVIKNANGGVLELKEDAKLNADKTEAELESLTSQIPVGKYTLSYNNGDAVEFEVVKAVVKSIVLTTSDTAIMDKEGREAYVYYKVLDQFGNDVTKSPVASRLSITGSPKATSTMGKVTFAAQGEGTDPKFQPNLSRVNLTIVDLNTGVSLSKILTVGQAANLDVAKFEKIFNTNKKEFVENVTDGDTLSNYQLLFTAVDQFGNDFVTEEGKDQLIVSAVGTTGVTVEQGKASIVEYKDKKYYGFKLKSFNADGKASRTGEVTIQAVSARSGKTLSEKFNVIASNKVTNLRVWEGNNGVFDGIENELMYTAYDANGKEVTDADQILALNAKNSELANKVKFKKKSDGKVGLFYDLKTNRIGLTDTNTRPDSFVLRTMSDTGYVTVNVNVKAQQYPVGIVGLKSDTVVGAVAGQKLTITGDKVRFQDQYGNLVSADDISKLPASELAKYKVKVTLAVVGDSNSKAAFKLDDSSNPGTAKNFTGAEKTVSDDITKFGNSVNVVSLLASTGADLDESAVISLELQYDSKLKGDKKTFTVYAPKIDNIKNIAIADPGLKAASNVKDLDGDTSTDAAKGFTPEVSGFYMGEKIALKAGEHFVVLNSVGTAGTHVAVPSLADEKTTVTKTDEISVVLKNADADVLKKTYSYSNAARVVKSVDFDGKVIEHAAGKIAWDQMKGHFTIKDQYGEALEKVAPYITFSDITDKTNVSIEGTNGTKDAKLSFSANSESKVKIKLTFPGSGYVFEKVVDIKKA